MSLSRRAPRGSFAGAIIGTAPLSAIVAGLITVGLWPAENALDMLQVVEQPLFGSFLNLAFAWLLLALLHWLLGFDRADRADARSFGSMLARRDQLESRLRLLVHHESATSNGSGSHSTRKMALHEALDHLGALNHELQAGGPGWILGHAYMDAWRRLNRAEEALLECAPAPLTAAEAKFDVLRLRGAGLDQAGEIEARLHTAIDVLQDHGADCPPSSTSGPASACQSVDEARCWIRQVRRSLDDYRLDRWMGLLHARNRLLASIVFTSFTVYVLLWLSIVAGVSREAILAVTAFYFVGATVGLFNRLYSDAAAGPPAAGSDYSLGATRLLGIPLLSGVAAVLGVLLQTALAAATSGAATDLRPALDFASHPLNVVTAALFGLTPGLVLDRLRSQTDRYRDELKSLEPSAPGARSAHPAVAAAAPPSTSAPVSPV